MKINRDDKLTAVVSSAIGFGVDVSKIADSSCSIGNDLEGSTGLEVFSAGFDLRSKIKNDNVWVAIEGSRAFFFIGKLDTIIERFSNVEVT